MLLRGLTCETLLHFKSTIKIDVKKFLTIKLKCRPGLYNLPTLLSLHLWKTESANDSHPGRNVPTVRITGRADLAIITILTDFLPRMRHFCLMSSR